MKTGVEEALCSTRLAEFRRWWKIIRLNFTIVDLGKTIKTGVNNFLKKNLSGIEYIAWAVEEGNTTKRGTIPGGLGLSLIREFLKIF